jgi:diguanylate cyclase (GGDEF)-like protein
MNSSADSENEAKPLPGSLAGWLQGQTQLLPEIVTALLAVIGPLKAMVSIKSLTTGRYVCANDDFNRLLASEDASILGRTDSELLRSEDAASLRRVEQLVVAQGQPITCEHKLEIAGQRRVFEVTRALLGSEFLLATWHECTKERQHRLDLERALQQIEQQQKALVAIQREQLQSRSNSELAGHEWTAQLNQQLRREIDLSTREHREFALAIIALDPLPAELQLSKESAQELGLETMGRILRDNIRAMDAVCRIGERCFAVLLSGVGLATAHARMEQLRRHGAAQFIVLDGRDLGLSLSIGVGSFPHTASSQDDLLSACEAAVQQAQSRGGKQVVLAAISFCA